MYILNIIILLSCLSLQILGAEVQEADYIIPKYTFRNDEQLENLKIHYYTLGTPKKNINGKIVNAVLLLHWTAASGKVFLSENFMSSLYASSKPLDINKYFIIIPDNIGHGNSSKPSDSLRMNFPHYGYLDMVDLQHKLITEKLGIEHLKIIIGTSMGGMHTWLWSEIYPHFMDGAMPIVALPTQITGRNLLWRQIIVQAIKNDPEWQGGAYKKQPNGFISTWPFAHMLLDGVAHLHKEIINENLALTFIQEAEKDASLRKDANDVLYALEASKDYNPEPNLDKITAKIFALDFTDDQPNPAELNILPILIRRVKDGRAVIQEGTPDSFGHLTMAHPELWFHQLESFILSLK